MVPPFAGLMAQHLLHATGAPLCDRDHERFHTNDFFRISLAKFVANGGLAVAVRGVAPLLYGTMCDVYVLLIASAV